MTWLRTLSRRWKTFPFTLACALVLAAGCTGADAAGTSDHFLDGTADNPQIGLVVNSLGKALTMFQLGAPSEQRQI